MTKSSNIPARTGGPSQRLTARALLEVKRLHDPQFHPDGQRIAFSVHEADFDESRWVSHIWLTEYLPPDDDPHDNAPGPDDLTRQLTFSAEGETDPRWSPDGRYLAFLSARPDPSVAADEDDEEEPAVAQIWALPLDGGEARKITNAKEQILDYAWTPDGESLIYLTLTPHPRPFEGLHKERQRRKVDPIVEHADPRRRQFWSISVEERKPQLLFAGDYGIESFALSPEGDRIAYLTNYTGDDNDYHIADLYLRCLESGNTVKVVQRAGGKYRLRWSPTGTHIAFLSWLDPLVSYSRESICMAEVSSCAVLSAAPQAVSALPDAGSLGQGASIHELIRAAQKAIEAPGIADALPISELDFDVTSFEWCNDQIGIFALAAVGAATEVYRFDHSGLVQQVSSGEVDRREIAVHGESGRAAWVQESAASAPEIVLCTSDGEEHVLTALNASLAESYRLPSQEVVHWSSSDGQTIEGVLTYPIDHVPGQKAPLIVQIHGGPKGRALDTLLDYPMPAAWASEGYLVLRPNYRGSEGYGNAFAVANYRDLGGRDFDDIMSGVDWCIEQGLAHKDRIGVLGGSYGGYLVNWAIGHTDRFKAAISMFGIFHLQTDYSNSRLSRWEHDYIGAYYWEEPEIYRKLSPASYLENIRTPTLIIHGDEDDNTSLSNSREMYRALLQRGVSAQFVHYPREEHGIQEPNHRLDELRRCFAWMDRHLRVDSSLSAYRIGDRVLHQNGYLELCVTSAEPVSLIGQPKSEEGREGDEPTNLAVTLAIHNHDQGDAREPFTLQLADIRLTGAEPDTEVFYPAGVPLDVLGGKVLVKGESLHITQHPDLETGELAFALSVVFRLPRSGSGLLQVADFPVVAIHWSGGGDEETTEI